MPFNSYETFVFKQKKKKLFVAMLKRSRLAAT